MGNIRHQHRHNHQQRSPSSNQHINIATQWLTKLRTYNVDIKTRQQCPSKIINISNDQMERKTPPAIILTIEEVHQKTPQAVYCTALRRANASEK